MHTELQFQSVAPILFQHQGQILNLNSVVGRYNVIKEYVATLRNTANNLMRRLILSSAYKS